MNVGINSIVIERTGNQYRMGRLSEEKGHYSVPDKSTFPGYLVSTVKGGFIVEKNRINSMQDFLDTKTYDGWFDTGLTFPDDRITNFDLPAADTIVKEGSLKEYSDEEVIEIFCRSLKMTYLLKRFSELNYPNTSHPSNKIIKNARVRLDFQNISGYLSSVLPFLGQSHYSAFDNFPLAYSKACEFTSSQNPKFVNNFPPNAIAGSPHQLTAEEVSDFRSQIGSLKERTIKYGLETSKILGESCFSELASSLDEPLYVH